jgi:hypothetical protein
MLPHFSFRKLAAAGLIFAYFGALPFVTYAQTAPSPTAPTAKQDPALVDQAWQKASSKYDAQRSALVSVSLLGSDEQIQSQQEADGVTY